jgi:uncharacterized protein YfaS (alpha-2-macroglobulin family)
MKRKYRVVLPIDVDGKVYQYGETAELDETTAAAYAHALIAIEEESQNGGND